MITVHIYRNTKGDIYGFDAENHGDRIVCAAVSALVLNTVNSIEKFTEETFECDFEEDGGYLTFQLPGMKDGGNNHDVSLLLESLALGLNGIMHEYSKHIIIYEVVK